MRISGWSSDVCSSDLIAIDRRGRVAVAMQYEGPADDDVPLVALHDPGAGETGFRYLPMPRAEQTALRQYCGSAAIDRTGRYLAVSSPRGNCVLVWDLAADAMPMVASVPLGDVCGLGASGEAGGRSEEHTSELPSLMRI